MTAGATQPRRAGTARPAERGFVVRGAQDAEHLAQLVDGLAAGPLDRRQRPPGTVGLALEYLLGARRLQHHLADRVRDRVVGLVRHPLALARHRDALADRALLLKP